MHNGKTLLPMIPSQGAVMKLRLLLASLTFSLAVVAGACGSITLSPDGGASGHAGAAAGSAGAGGHVASGMGTGNAGSGEAGATGAAGDGSGAAGSTGASGSGAAGTV